MRGPLRAVAGLVPANATPKEKITGNVLTNKLDVMSTTFFG
jgi:hypothetical protein